MDADWSVEIGEDLPWIEVPWQGWADLRDPSPARQVLRTLAEVLAYPELGGLLLDINTGYSATVLTSKCDVFPVDGDTLAYGLTNPDDQDPDDGANGSEREPLTGLGSYIDLCVTADPAFSDFAWHEALARCVAAELLAPMRLPRTSVELVIRRASLFTQIGFGLTLYATGYGRGLAEAREAWAQLLRISASVTIEEITRRVSGLAQPEQ